MKRIKRKIKELARKNYLFSYLLSLFLYPAYYKDERLNRVIDSYDSKTTSKMRMRITLYAHQLTYLIGFDEYYLFGFENLNNRGKRRFVGDKERIDLYDSIGTTSSKEIFDNKYETYKHFKEFYGREVVKISEPDDRNIYESFISENKDIIVKPISRSFGRGIWRLRIDDEDFLAEKAFDRILSEGECLLEQRIEQSEEMSAFHPSSINTLRLFTCNEDGHVRHLFSWIRIGRGNNVVDNVGSGGIESVVDLEYGITYTPGMDELGNRYLLHPDTGKQLIGFKIPRWEEALALTVKLAQVIPEQRVVAWDLALTDSGWIMVEGNRRGQFGSQFANGIGCRDVIETVDFT